jgi:hypothetical protein
MTGQLIQVATETVTSSTTYVDLIGTTTDDVYLLAINNCVMDTASQIFARVLVGGTADTTNNYDYLHKYLKSDTTFSNHAETNLSIFPFTSTISSSVSGGNGNGIFYLFDFNANKYSFATFEETHLQESVNSVRGQQGTCVNTVVQSCNGIRILPSLGNIVSGTFTLYRQVGS